MKYKTYLKLFFIACWFALVGFLSPFMFSLVWVCLTGTTKGVGVDLGSEKDIVLFMGIVFLFIFIAVIASILYLTLKVYKQNRRIAIYTYYGIFLLTAIVSLFLIFN